MKKAKFTAIIGMAVMMSIPVASLAGNEKQVEIVNENIRYCESTYPYNGGILIANFGTEQLNPLNAEGKGYILYYKNTRVRVRVPLPVRLQWASLRLQVVWPEVWQVLP